MEESSEPTNKNNNAIIIVVIGIVILLLLCLCCTIPFLTMSLIGSRVPGSSNNDLPQIDPIEPITTPGYQYFREYEVGEIVESDGNTFIVLSYEDNVQPANEEMILKNEKLVAVYISVTNTEQFDTYFSEYDWMIRDEKDLTYYAYTKANYKEPIFESKTLSPGETISGWLTFPVSKDAKSLSVVPNTIDIYSGVVLY